MNKNTPNDLFDSLELFFVDLDGTLINTDLGFYSLRKYILPRFWRCAFILFWWGRGRNTYVKRELAKRVEILISEIPWIEKNVEYMRGLKNKGKRLILATGSDIAYANMIAEHLKIFEGVIASDGVMNTIGYKKLNAMKKYAGDKPFAYVGNSTIDLRVWSGCQGAIVANAPVELVEEARKLTTVLDVI